MNLAELENEVKSLTPADLDAFTRWLDEYAAAKWDRQLEADVAAGKLDALGRQADEDFTAGNCREL